jgi:hypothetical protein
VLLAKRPRFGLDRRSNSGRRPDEMIDVPTARPAHTVPHHPSAVGQPAQSMLDRSLCVGTHTPAVGDALRTAGPPKQGGPEREKREDHERVSPDPRSAQADEENQHPAEQISVASDSMSVLLTTREGHASREHTATSLEPGDRQLSCCKFVTVLAHQAGAAGLTVTLRRNSNCADGSPGCIMLTVPVLRSPHPAEPVGVTHQRLRDRRLRQPGL